MSIAGRLLRAPGLSAGNDGIPRTIGWSKSAAGRDGKALNLQGEDTDTGHVGGAVNVFTGYGFDSNGFNIYEGVPGSGGGANASHVIMQMFGEGGGTPKIAMIGSTATAWQSLNSVGGHVPAFFTAQYYQFNYDSDCLFFDGTTITLRVQVGKIGFLGATPQSKPTITGSKGANAALGSLVTALAAYGLVTDSTT